MVGYNTAACCVIDTETGQVVTRLDTAQDPVSGQVLKLKRHVTSEIFILNLYASKFCGTGGIKFVGGEKIFPTSFFVVKKIYARG